MGHKYIDGHVEVSGRVYANELSVNSEATFGEADNVLINSDGITVNGNKVLVEGEGGSGGGKLYQHNIMVSSAAVNGTGLEAMFCFTIYRSTNVQLTNQELLQYLALPRPISGYYSIYNNDVEIESVVNPMIMAEGAGIIAYSVEDGLLRENTLPLSNLNIAYMGILEV